MRDHQSESHYFPVRYFGKLAQGVNNLKKGTKVLVEGELVLPSFTEDEGQKQVTFRVTATTYCSLGNGRQTDKAEGLASPTQVMQERSYLSS